MVLCEIADLDVVSYFEHAEVIELPHDTFDECGFSFAVLADERYFLASADGEGDVMEDVVFAKIFAQVFDDKREISAPRSRRESQVEA